MILLGFIVRIPDNRDTGVANGLAIGLLVVLVPFMVESGGFFKVSVQESRVGRVFTMVDCFA
eukprot:7408347-Ditylum_brightwellii.AAC.1